MSVLTVTEQHGHIVRSGGADWSLNMAQRAAVAGFDVWFYAGKLFWPVPLSFVYPRWEIDAGLIVSFAPLLGILVVLMVLWSLREHPWGRACLVGIGYFIVALLPVLGLFDIFYFRYSFVADHFQYLAGAGLVALAAAGIATIVRSTAVRGWLGAALVLVLCVLSWRHCGAFQTSETLWRDTIAGNPGCWMAHYNLGATLVATGRIEEGMEQYEQALQARPDYAEAHNNLGAALMQSGRTGEAMLQYKQALEINPQDAGAHYNLGLALVQMGRFPEAITHFEEALRLDPVYAEAHNNLGAALVHAGKIEEGIAQYQQALQINPKYSQAHDNLGTALVHSGKIEEGIAQYEQALQANPQYAKAHYNLGLALAQSGKLPEAITHFEEALRLRPDYPEARTALEQAQGRLTNPANQPHP
jgi:tetratricopeptide (TPR) repeat protein